MSLNMVEEDFSSLAEHVMNRELYEDSSPVYDEGCSSETEVPFTLLHGESPTNFTLCNNGEQLFVLTNYRLFASMEDGFYSVPLGLIEYAELRHSTDLLILCKDCRSFKLSFENDVQSRSWMDRVLQAIKPKSNFNDLFPFIHHAYKLDSLAYKEGTIHPHSPNGYGTTSLLTSEYHRMGMNLSEMWRITECNTKYKICSSYPKLFIVPRSITDSDLDEVAKFRSLGRVPSVVWRHSGNGCVLVRCSQPLVGVLGWRCQEDEKFLDSLAQSCSQNRFPPTTESMEGAMLTNGHTLTTPSVLILDLRSYAAALGNRAKGGGCEHQDYYPNCEIRYKGLANIHSVKRSFLNLRTLLTQNSASINFLSFLEGTQWLYTVSQLLSTSIDVVSTIHHENRPVVVHCSDGWDRTTQVVALAEILLDPFYRSFEGFKILVEREWISFGHKFSDRCGFGADGEQSPIFIQWLDCVYQLMRQFPTAFEFNVSYLIKLAHHSYSLLCGTFLLNCEQQREEQQLSKHTLSIWSLLNKNDFTINALYSECDDNGVLFPSWYVRDLYLWQELYCTSHLIPYSSATPLQLPHKSEQVTPSKISSFGRVCLQNGKSDSTDLETNKLSSSPTTIKSNTGTINSNTGTINSNNSHDVDDKNNNDSLQGKDSDNNLVLSNMFHSFAINKTCSNANSQNGGNNFHTNSIPSSVMDMEDSFRVIDDAIEPSLTASTIKRLSSSISDGDPALTPISVNNLWSVGVASNSKLDLSTFSECESRLRNLSEDGMSLYQDPVQERVRIMEEQYQERISQLEEKVKRVTVMLRHKMDSSNGERRDEDHEDILELISESSDNVDQPVSPSNGWTHVGVEDAVGVHWIPDHAVSHCKQCGAEFWMGKRKHHCRNCGGVFCWKCTNYYCPVPREQLYGDQRVCRRCFDRLDGYIHLAKQKN